MMRPFARAVVAAAAAAALPAAANDWSISGFASQRLEASDNGADRLRSVSDLGFTAVTRTPRSQFTLAPGVRVSLTNGDGGFDVLPRFNGSGRIFGPTTTVTATASLLPQFVDDARFEDDAAFEDPDAASGLQLTGTFGLSVEQLLTPRDSVSAGVNGRLTTFVGDGDRDDTTRFGLDLGFTRRLSTLTSVSVTPSASVFSGGAGGDGYSVSTRVGVQTSLTPRHQVSLSAGPSVTFRDSPSDVTPGVVGGASLSYDAGPTTFTLALNQDVDSGATRGLETRTTLNAGVGHQLTSRSRLALNGSVSARRPLDDDDGDSRITFSLSPTYSVDLAPSWTASVGYQLRGVSGDGADESLRSSVFLNVSRGLSLLP